MRLNSFNGFTPLTSLVYLKMKKLTSFAILLIAGLFTFQSIAQNSKARLKPGRRYEAGDTIFAPRFGFTAKVPEGWQGVLPRDTEVFMLMSMNTSVYGELYIFGRDQGDINSMRDAWIKGFDLTETIRLKASNPTITGGTLSSEVIAVGETINEGYKAFAIARCNPEGPCITLLAKMPAQFYDAIKNTATQFMERSEFETPSNVSIYADFNWKEFLSNKALLDYAYVDGGSKENEIQFCTDGTFTSNIKKSGLLKNENPEYRGRNSGTWTVEGVGEQTTLHITFKKKELSPLDIVLSIKDEKIYANGDRYFVGEASKCK